MSAPGRLPLPGGPFQLWSWSCLRGAGFEASGVLDLAAPELASAIDDVLTAEADEEAALGRAMTELRTHLTTAEGDERRALQRARKLALKRRPTEAGVALPSLSELADRIAGVEHARARIAPAWTEAEARAAVILRSVATEPRFREAVTWQNRPVVERCLDRVAAGRGDRRDERLVATYLQRYCTKNESIGFFGPIGWARLEETGPFFSSVPGDGGFVTARGVHFEQWVIDALAERLSTDERRLHAMAPRRYPFVTIEGDRVKSALTGVARITPAELQVLAACDGVTTADALAAGDDGVYAILRGLREKKLVAWSIEVPLQWEPAQALANELARVEDDAIRAPALAALATLERGRARVAASAGDPTSSSDALRALDDLVVETTGRPPTRNEGVMYAARTAVFEDTRRNATAAFGPAFREGIGPALTCVLQSARWFTWHTAGLYRRALREAYADVEARAKSGPVSFVDFWFRIQRLLHGTKARPLDRATGDLAARWAEVLGPIPEGERRIDFTTAALAPKVASAFDAPGPGWQDARHHSPDLMIAATDVAAMNRGEWIAVLGELHAGVNTLAAASFVGRHPAPEALLGLMTADLPLPRVLPVVSKDGPRATVRTSTALVGDKDFALEWGLDRAPLDRARTFGLHDLVAAVEGEEVVVRSRDGRLRTTAVELLGFHFSLLASTAFRLFPPASHSPRVTIDRLVVARESWAFDAKDLAFAFAASDSEQFVGARGFLRGRGLPRFVFVKSPLETKPFYVDFASPTYVGALVAQIRRLAANVTGDRELRVSEMFPSMDALWLRGPNGGVTTCETRLVAFDPS